MYLNAEGDKLTRKIRYSVSSRGGGEPQPVEVEIKNGEITDNKLSFEVVRETPNGAIKITYDGRATDQGLKLTIKSPGRGGEPAATEVVANSVRCPPEPPSNCVK